MVKKKKFPASVFVVLIVVLIFSGLFYYINYLDNGNNDYVLVDDLESEIVESNNDGLTDEIFEEEGFTDQRLSVESIIDMFKAAELPIGSIIHYTEENCPEGLLRRPEQYIERADFEDTRLDQNVDLYRGGSIEVFFNKSDLDKRMEHLESVASDILNNRYRYIYNNVIIRLDDALTSEEAQEYESILID